MGTRVGRMRYKVALQKPTNTTDSGGGMTQAWTTLIDIWADIRPISGKELFRHNKMEESVTHEIYIRHREDIGTNYRINYDSRNFNIRHIRNIEERDRYMLLVCTEGDAI